MDWVEAIGYQHEVLHTAVLAQILRSDQAPAVASALLGGGEVATVEDVCPEHRLNGRRPVDLAVSVVMSDGRRTRLGVETKVDSAWTPRQLRETVPAGCRGVLLAVGYTALAATQRDLDVISQEGAVWQLARPADWGALALQHAGGDREIERYARRVLREASEHAHALEAVTAGRPLDINSGRNAQALEHWAYFHEAIRERDDVAQWERKTLRSGPLLTRWVVHYDGDRGDYLEFGGDRTGRSLSVKTYAPPHTGALAESRARIRDLLANYPTLEPPKQPAAKDKTCTVARLSLNGRSPREASALADDLALLLQPSR